MSPFILASIAALFVGLAKAGLKGLGTVAVVFLALAYGARASTGIMLPLLILGDIFAVIYYKRYVKWKYLFKFTPAIVVGILIAVYFGKDMPEESFKLWMAGIILLSVVLLLFSERTSKAALPNNWLFAGTLGILTGFTTMIGNMAGAFSNIFFLSTRLPKNELLGTVSWLFLFINLFKLPFHIFSWKTLAMDSFIQSMFLIPGVVIGFLVGLKLVALFNEKNFRLFLLAATALGALVIIIK